MLSFYALPSTIIGNKQAPPLRLGFRRKHQGRHTARPLVLRPPTKPNQPLAVPVEPVFTARAARDTGYPWSRYIN